MESRPVGLRRMLQEARPWRMEDRVPEALRRQGGDDGGLSGRPLARRQHLPDAINHPLAHDRHREATGGGAGTSSNRGLVGGLRIGVVAGARPVRVHGTVALRVVALVVRSGGVEGLYERLYGGTLQANRHDDEDAQKASPPRPTVCGERNVHGGTPETMIVASLHRMAPRGIAGRRRNSVKAPSDTLSPGRWGVHGCRKGRKEIGGEQGRTQGLRRRQNLAVDRRAVTRWETAPSRTCLPPGCCRCSGCPPCARRDDSRWSIRAHCPRGCG